MVREGELHRRFEALESRQMELAEDLWELWRLLLGHRRRLKVLEEQPPKKKKQSRRRGAKK